MDSSTVRRILSKLVLLLALSGTLFSFVGLPRSTVWAQDEKYGQIAYIGEDGNLWLMNMDGSNQTQLTHLTEDKVWMYAWSPDGSRIACLGEVSHSLYVVALPEMSLHHVVGIERIYQLVWSPNGERLAVVTSGDIRATVGSSSWADDNRILLVDLADWEVQEIADGYAPQWAPDGRELFYVSNYRETEDHPQEIRAVSTTGDVRAVTGLHELGTTLPIESLTLSPDGSRIAVWGASLELIGTLWTLRADGSELRRIVEWVQPNQFDWSPDGVWLVYREEGEAFATDTGPTGLSLTNVATGETQMFLHDRRQGNEILIASYPTWTSDSTSIVFCESHTELVMMDPSTQARDFEEGDTLTEGCPVAYPELGLGLAASWSPDGQHLAVEQAGQICVVGIGCLADGHLPAWRPAVPGPSKERIAYIGPDGNVWLISSDGTNPTQVTEDAVEGIAGSETIRYRFLSWSPDGQLLAFARTGGYYELLSLQMYTTADGSLEDVQDVTSAPIAWKADSSGFAFEHQHGIWEIDLASGHMSEIVPPRQGYSRSVPVWSPDGKYLSFEEYGLSPDQPGFITEGHGYFALFEIDTKTVMPWDEIIGNYGWLGSDYLVYDQVPWWSQLGSRLWRSDVNGDDHVPLTPVSASTSDRFPRVSPTGDRIAFFRGEEDPFRTPLWIMNADGTDAYQATPFVVRYAAWAPDGQKLAVETGAYQEEEILILNLITGETQKIADGSNPVWQPLATGPVDLSITGKVTDGHNGALPGVFVSLWREGESSHIATTTTDSEGNYTFTEMTESDTYRVQVILQDESGRTLIYYGKGHDLVDVKTQPFSFPAGSATIVKNIDFGDTPLNSRIPAEHLDDLAVMFTRSQQVNNFVRNELGETDFQPVRSIWGFSPLSQSKKSYVYYCPSVHEPNTHCPYGHSINIHEEKSEWNHADSPMNREWHENFHHLMLMALGPIPFVNDESATNHGGYDNPSTRDSWNEGWAEFWSCALRDTLDWSAPHIYLFEPFDGGYPISDGWISLEYNWKVWDRGGPIQLPSLKRRSREEFAVASLLWDLYDPKEPSDSDNVDLSLDTLWSVIGTTTTHNHMRDVLQVYNAWLGALANEIPLTNEDGTHVTRADIDQIFIVHGFYADDDDHEWESDENVGWGGRPYRPNTPAVQNAYLRINVEDENGDPVQNSTLLVEVRFDNSYYDYSYTVDLSKASGNMIYLELPPTRTVATAELTAIYDGMRGEPYTTDNATYWDKVSSSSTGYAEELTLTTAPTEPPGKEPVTPTPSSHLPGSCCGASGSLLLTLVAGVAQLVNATTKRKHRPRT